MDPREQIKSKIDLVQFIQEFIPLKQTGRNFKALCPFHAEKTPSFVVSAERQIWHCFGCSKGGDVFTFLMEFERMEFSEALRELAKRTGVKLTSFTPGKSEQEREKLFAINHLASEFYHYILTSHRAGERALAYLKNRGIARKTIDTFKIGFAADKWELLFDFLTKKKGFVPEDLEKAGVVVRSQKAPIRQTQGEEVISQNYYDRFRNRVMFTLRDHRGNVVGFAGRLLDPEAKEAKYINTPETLLYHKGELFYGLDIVKEAIRKENQAILVEGEFDMLSSFQAGVANVIALKGTALTEMQAKLIKRFTQNIALAFDEDIAGDVAARRGISIAENEGLNIKIIRVKDGKDPDEALRKSGVAGWKKAIKQAVSVYDFLIDSAVSRNDPASPEGKKAISDDVLPAISKISNEIVKAHFIKRLSRELEVSEEAILRQIEKLSKLKEEKNINVSPLKVEKPSRQEVLEEYFLSLLLQKADLELMKKVRLEVDPEFFQNILFRKIFNHLLKFYENEQTLTISDFVKYLPKEMIPAVDRLYLLDVEAVTLEKLFSEIEWVIQELKVLLLRKQMEQLKNDLKEKEKGSDEEILSALKKKFSLLSSRLNELTTRQNNLLPN